MEQHNIPKKENVIDNEIIFCPDCIFTPIKDCISFIKIYEYIDEAKFLSSVYDLNSIES
jgi:hypothetical protein